MKSAIKRILIRKKGSLTVEAALVLPIFICAILTIGFMTKLVYVQEIVQHAIDEAANEMASTSYIYYTSGIYDIDSTISDELNDKKGKSEEHLEKIVECYGELSDSISKIEINSRNLHEDINGVNLYDSTKSLKHIASGGEDIDDNIGELQSIIKDIASDPKGEMISLASLMAKEGYDNSKTIVGNALIRHYMNKHGLSNNRLERLNIEKLDLSSSTYFEDNEDIDVIVKYNLDIPLPIKFINYFTIVQRAKVRAWMGGENVSAETKNGEADSANTGRVYVSKKGSSYHRFGCYHIFKEIEELDLQEARKLGLEQCKKCRPPLNSNGKYTVFKSKRNNDGKYHREGCNYLFKEIMEIDLEEAIKRYKPCKTCKPPEDRKETE